MTCMGTQDHRPSFSSFPTNCSYYCRTPALATGLFLQNVQAITLTDVTVQYAGPVGTRLPWYAHTHTHTHTHTRNTTTITIRWGACLNADAQSSGIQTHNFTCVNGPTTVDATEER